MRNMTSNISEKMKSFWDNIDWKLLDRIKRRKKKPSVWDLK